MKVLKDAAKMLFKVSMPVAAGITLAFADQLQLGKQAQLQLQALVLFWAFNVFDSSLSEEEARSDPNKIKVFGGFFWLGVVAAVFAGQFSGCRHNGNALPIEEWI